MRARLIVLACTICWAAVPPLAAQPTTVDQLLDHIGRYTLTFVDRFSNVVAEERYVQRSSAAQGPRRRVLRSDFLLVRASEASSYTPFRDVYEVDGMQVRDREGRLEALLLKPSANSMEQANAIADEGSRYNLGSDKLRRTVNSPVLALAFLQPALQPHFRFTLESSEAALAVLRFVEQQRPSLIRGAFDTDIIARGRVWVDIENGRVMKTELILNDAAVTAQIATTFQFDDRFGIAVPSSMTDRFLLRGLQLDGDATYGRFRRFGVTTDEAIQTPTPRH